MALTTIGISTSAPLDAGPRSTSAGRSLSLLGTHTQLMMQPNLNSSIQFWNEAVMQQIAPTPYCKF